MVPCSVGNDQPSHPRQFQSQQLKQQHQESPISPLSQSKSQSVPNTQAPQTPISLYQHLRWLLIDMDLGIHRFVLLFIIPTTSLTFHDLTMTKKNKSPAKRPIENDKNSKMGSHDKILEFVSLRKQTQLRFLYSAVD